MSKHEQRAEHAVSSMAQVHTPDNSPAISAIRPIPGHPLASLPLCEQERAQHPEPSMTETETVATWANLEELAHEWGTFARDLAFITSPASAHIYPPGELA